MAGSGYDIIVVLLGHAIFLSKMSLPFKTTACRLT